MLAEDFGDGGAFAEIHVPQYPLGLGMRRAAVVTASSSTTSSVGTSSGLSSRLFESALVVKSSGSELIGATTEEIQNNVQRTREALQRALDEQSSTVGNHSQRSDPLDPRIQKKPSLDVAATSSTALVIAVDPAPIVRSPPKKARSKEEQASEKELSSVPFCVSSWTNKKNLVIALEDRVASAHEETEGPKLGDNHIRLAMALSRAKKDVVQQHTLEAKMEREAQEKQQAEVEGSALKDAQALLEAMEQQRSAQQATETREARQDRLRLEREQRERERAIKAKLRRHQEAAARLGITVEALEADAELLRSIDTGAAGKDGDELAELVDARVLQEASRKQDDNGRTVDGDAVNHKAFHVSTRGIENEIKILDAAASAETVPKRPRTSETDSEDSDEDLFGVADILQQQKGGRRL